MSIKFGRAKSSSKLTIEDWLRHPIWMSAHDGRHDEESFKPVDSTEGVTSEVLRIDAPIIALRVIGTAWLGTGYYDSGHDRLYCVFFYVGGKWIEPNAPHGWNFPLELESVPPILGTANARFILSAPNALFAERAG